MIQLAQLMEIRPNAGQAATTALEPAEAFVLDMPAEAELAQPDPTGAEAVLPAAPLAMNIPLSAIPAQLGAIPTDPQGGAVSVDGRFALRALAGAVTGDGPAIVPPKIALAPVAGASDPAQAEAVVAAPLAGDWGAAASGPAISSDVVATARAVAPDMAAGTPAVARALTGVGAAKGQPVSGPPPATGMPELAGAGAAVKARVPAAGPEPAGVVPRGVSAAAPVVTAADPPLRLALAASAGSEAVAQVHRSVPGDGTAQVQVPAAAPDVAQEIAAGAPAGARARAGGGAAKGLPAAGPPLATGMSAQAGPAAAPVATAPDPLLSQPPPDPARPVAVAKVPGDVAAPAPVPPAPMPSGPGQGALSTAAQPPGPVPLPGSPMPIPALASGADRGQQDPAPLPIPFPVSRHAAAELRFHDRLASSAAFEPADHALVAPVPADPPAAAPLHKRAAATAPGAPAPVAVPDPADPALPAAAVSDHRGGPFGLPGTAEVVGAAAPLAAPAQPAPLPGIAGAEQGAAPLAVLAVTGAAAPLRGAEQPVAPPTAPPQAEALTRQVAERIATLGADRAEVQLSPAELGRLRFEITQRGETVQVVVSAERSETLDLLRRNGEQLLDELRTMGFSGSALNFGAWGGRSGGAEPPPPPEPEPPAPPEPHAATPIVARSPTRADGRGLDLRL